MKFFPSIIENGLKTTLSALILTVVFLTFFALSKTLTASLDNKCFLLWLPNRLLGALLGTALAIVTISQGWLWLSPAFRGFAVPVKTSRIIAWSMGQDQRFGLSTKALGLARKNVQRIDGMLRSEIPDQGNKTGR